MRANEICEERNAVRKGRTYIRRVQNLRHLKMLLDRVSGLLRGWSSSAGDLWVWDGEDFIHAHTQYDIPDGVEVPVYVYKPNAIKSEIYPNDHGFGSIETDEFTLIGWSPTGGRKAIERLRGVRVLRDLINQYRPPSQDAV